MADEPRVFISSSASDREWTRHLLRALKEEGVAAFLDADSSSGAAWVEELLSELSNSTHVVVVVTPESTESSFVAAEIGAALAQGKHILPVVSGSIRGEDVPGPLRRRQWIELDTPGEVAKRIAKIIT